MSEELLLHSPTEPIKREKKIPVMEVFGPTIQGEGAMIGVRTTFIRFGLCDYKCVMCDSMHAVDPIRVKANATWMTQFEIAEEYFKTFKDGSHSWCTLSGGNPAMHNLEYLVERLFSNGISCAIETQGTLLPEWISMCDVITVSPKSPGMGEKFEIDKFQAYVDKFRAHPGFNVKVVVFSAQDIEFARAINSIMVEAGCYDKMYLSLGNPYPPGLENKLMPAVNEMEAGFRDESLKVELLRQYRIMAEDLLLIPDMHNVKFLPQLHVLTWANKQKV